MPLNISSIFDSSNGINRLVDMYMQLESQPRNKAAQKRENIRDRKKVLTNLDSKLTALNSKANRLTDSITDYFAVKNTESSNKEYLTASANQNATLGNHSFTVERLATADTRVSKQYSDASSSFSAVTQDQTFSITIAHPIDTDASNRVAIAVTVASNKFTQTDDKVLTDIADAINTAMANAVTADTIENDEVVHATVVTEETGKSRLIFTSNKSGYTNRMEFTDSANSLLQSLEINASTQSSGTSGGYMTVVGTSAADSQLNSKFTMDGLTFYRDSNQVADALTGVTLNFLNTFSTAETLTVSTDTEKVKKEINGYLDAYNEALTFLKEKSQVDPDTRKRGPLADDTIYRQFSGELRSRSISTVSTSSSTYTSLFSIGIETDRDGKLSIKDMEKFITALETNTQNVSDVFNASDGIATRVNSYLESFVKTGGTIDSSKENIDNTVIRMNDRIDRMDDVLLRRQAQLKAQFVEIQEAMSRIANQQSFFTQMRSMF